MKYIEIWNLNCLVLESLTFCILDGQIETFIPFFLDKLIPWIFYIVSV